MSVKIAGHRGWPRRFPDNTLEGIQAARAVCDMVETDVRRTADGQLVLSHDPTIGGRVVVESTWDELAQVDVGNGHHPARFDDVLDAVEGFPLDIEIKNQPGDPDYDPEFETAMEIAVRARPIDVVTSFHWPTMAAVRDALPAVTTGLLVAPGTELARAADEALSGGHGVIAPHWSLLTDTAPAVVGGLVERGLAVVTWTVNDPGVAAHLAGAGVAVLISDDPPSIASAVADLREVGE